MTGGEAGARTRAINTGWVKAADTKRKAQEKVDRVQSERETTRQQWVGLSRAGNAGDLQKATKERLDALDASLTASREALKKAESDLGYWSAARYEDRSQRTQRALNEDPAAAGQYADAKKVIADQQKLYELIGYRQKGGGGSPEDAARFTRMEEELVRDYGLAPDAVNAYVGGYGTPYSEGLSVQQIMERMDSALAERKTALKEGSDRAAGYDFDDLYGYEQRVEAQKHREEVIKNAREAADEHPVRQTIGSVFVQPLRVTDVFTISPGRGDPGDPDYIPPYNRAGVGDIIDTTRGTVAEGIKNKAGDNWWGNSLSFLYSVGMSTVDSAATMAVMGPSSVYLMGTNAGVSNARDIIDRGGTIDQAIAGGVAAGAAEIIFEKFSVDNLLKPRTVSGWRSWVKETLKQGGVEASEEMATEIANILSDAAIMGEKSNFNQAVKAYQNQGMGEEEAKRKAYLDLVGQVALAGAGGFVSGDLMGGSVQGYNLHQYNQQSVEIGSQYSDKDLGRLYQENVAAGQAKTQKTSSTGETVKADTSLFKKSILQNLNQARSSFIEFARQHFPTSVKNAETGREIGISRTGLDKFLSGRIPYEKYASGFHIPELIERAHKIAQAENEHPGQVDSIPTYEYYDSPIDVNGTTYMAHIRVRNTRMGDKYYGHTISEIEDIKIEPSARTSAPGETPAVQPVNAIDGSTDSIPQATQDVNLRGRSLGDRVADATKRTLEEMARAEKKARFLKESKPLRDRLAQVQTEGEAGLAQTRAQYEKAVADREPGTVRVKDEEDAKKKRAKAEESSAQHTEPFTDKDDRGKMISGALNPESDRASAHAERYYEEVRHMATDVIKIAKATGYSESEIRAVKEFLFLEEHDLGGKTQRFYPDFAIAESWRRLMGGTPEPHDLTLLRHEIMEKSLMAQGYTQAEAHAITSKVYNYKWEADEFYDKINKHKEDG